MMKELMNNQVFLWIILLLIVSFGITLSSRYCGRDDEEYENFDQRIQLWIYILFSTILNYVFITAMMVIAKFS